MAIEVLAEYTTTVSVEEYLVRERQAAYKSDYVYGDIRAMAGASFAHTSITANVTIALGTQLKGTPCRTHSNDLKVAADPSGLYVYPDLTIVCGPPRALDNRRDVLLNPTVIIEVLSSSTETYDRGTKSEGYKQIESLREYLLISQSEPRVEQYSRQADGLWLMATARGTNGVIRLESIRCTLSLADVYEGVDFQP